MENKSITIRILNHKIWSYLELYVGSLYFLGLANYKYMDLYIIANILMELAIDYVCSKILQLPIKYGFNAKKKILKSFNSIQISSHQSYFIYVKKNSTNFNQM